MNKTRNIVLLATLGALIFVSMWLDRLLSAFLPVAFAIITITVVVAFGLIKDKLYFAFFSGVIFGVSSWIIAISTGNEAFINPLISVCPRLIMGLAMFAYYRLCQLIFKGKHGEKIALSITALLTAVTNTVLVVSALGLFAHVYYTGDALRKLVLINALPEAIACTILSPIIILAVRKALNRG